MKLHDYLRPSLVVLDLQTTGVQDTVHALVERLVEEGVVSDPDAIEQALVEREAVHTTAMGQGVAMPHTMIASLEEPVVLLGVAPEGTRFGPEGLDPVRLFFLLLSPADRASVHIKLLARICRLVRLPGVVDRLARADSADALLDELERIDREHV